MANFKRTPGCSVRDCCGGGGGGECVKIIPYGAPFADNEGFGARFANWNLSGLNQSNTYFDGTRYGSLRVVESFALVNGLTDNQWTVSLYKSASTVPANLVASWSTTTPAPGIIIGQTINFTEQNSSGITGSVVYDPPQTSYGTFGLNVWGTQTECDLSIGGTEITTVTWQITDISDPFVITDSGQTISLAGTVDLIRSLAILMADEDKQCTAEVEYTSPGAPLTATSSWAPFNGPTSYRIRFNKGNGFSIIWLIGSQTADAAITIEDLFDICVEVPETTLENSHGSTVTIRMDHTP